MKKLLPILICYVLTQSQCFAISGGPVYGGGSVSVTGSYSGTLQGVTEIDPATSGTPPIPGDPIPGGSQTTTSSNALGLFDLVVPGTTTATGAFLLFADGVIFGGTISASVDPDNAKLSGILNGQYSFSVSEIVGTTVTSVPVTATAVGMVNAKISSNSRGNSAARLNGSANLEISFGEVSSSTLAPVIGRVITFTVTGFQTTTAVNTASTIGTAGGSTGTGGQTN